MAIVVTRVCFSEIVFKCLNILRLFCVFNNNIGTMSADNNDKLGFDVNDLRKSWEIEDHWTLRRDFILTHYNKYPLDRLLCLAQMFVNIETMGNEYDPKLMEEVSNLANDVKSLRDLRKRKKQNLA